MRFSSSSLKKRSTPGHHLLQIEEINYEDFAESDIPFLGKAMLAHGHGNLLSERQRSRVAILGQLF